MLHGPHRHTFPVLTTPDKANIYLTTLANPLLPKSLHDDPAFSPDPLAHPFHDVWLLASATGTQPSIDSFSLPITSPSDEASSLTPGWVDDDATTLSHETASSATSTSSHSTAPTSHESHSFDLALASTAGPPLPGKHTKKDSAMPAFWRKMQAGLGTETDIANAREGLDQPPPSYNATLSADPLLPLSTEHPSLILTMAARPVSDLEPPRFIKVSKRVPPAAGARHLIAGIAISTHELDRIDELDESDPLGMPIHHESPSKAAVEMLEPLQPGHMRSQLLHNIGSEYQDPQPSHSSVQDSRRKPATRLHPAEAQISYVPLGLPLNLAPGQVLPYNFQSQYFYPIRSRLKSDELRAPAQAVHKVKDTDIHWLPDASDVTTRGGLNIPAWPIPIDASSCTDLVADRRMSMPKVIRSTPQSYLVDNLAPIRAFAKNVTSPASPMHTPSADRPPSRLHRDARLPPRIRALRREQAKNGSYSLDESMGHFTGLGFEAGESGRLKENIPINTPADQIPQLLPTEVQTFPSRSSVTPHRVSALPRSEVKLMTAQPPSVCNHDGRRYRHSSDNSTISEGSTSSRGHSRRPSHAPKHLIMPAPLQAAEAVAPRHRSNPPFWPRHMSDLPPRHRPSSSTSHISHLPFDHMPHLRAQEVPVFVPHNNKLRKRGTAPADIASISSLPFLPTIPCDPFTECQKVVAATTIQRLPHRSEKRNVLSKRRTDSQPLLGPVNT